MALPTPGSWSCRESPARGRGCSQPALSSQRSLFAFCRDTGLGQGSASCSSGVTEATGHVSPSRPGFLLSQQFPPSQPSCIFWPFPCVSCCLPPLGLMSSWIAVLDPCSASSSQPCPDPAAVWSSLGPPLCPWPGVRRVWGWPGGDGQEAGLQGGHSFLACASAPRARQFLAPQPRFSVVHLEIFHVEAPGRVLKRRARKAAGACQVGQRRC